MKARENGTQGKSSGDRGAGFIGSRLCEHLLKEGARVTKARQMLGYEPNVNMKEGIKRFAESYQGEKES